MRRIIVSEFVTIDNVMEDPGGAEGFKYGGWSFKFFNDEYMKYKRDELFAVDATLLGKKTYEAFAAAWPERSDPEGFADRMNSMHKYLVSSTTTSPLWGPCTVIKGDIWGQIREIKNGAGGDILVAGSGQLVQGLLAEGLVDELRLMVHPTVLGEGKRLFADGAPPLTMKLKDSQIFSTGTTALSYEPVKES